MVTTYTKPGLWVAEGVLLSPLVNVLCKKLLASLSVLMFFVIGYSKALFGTKKNPLSSDKKTYNHYHLSNDQEADHLFRILDVWF